jgi:hypothetical protein
LQVGRRIKRFTAYLAANQIHCDHIIPLPDQEMLKLDGFLGTDSPALAASGAFGHIVLQRSSIVPIVIT